MSSFVSNSNAGENNCQVVAEIYLPLDIDTERVRKIATEAALISKYIYLNKPIVVLFFNEIHEMRSVYKMRLKAYVSDLSKEFAFKSEMTEIVIKTLIEEKILLSDNLIN
jgi:small-conductance mechanosensitive channel